LLFAFNYPFVEFIAKDPAAMARVPHLLQSSVNGLALLLLAYDHTRRCLADTSDSARVSQAASRCAEVFAAGGGDSNALDR